LGKGRVNYLEKASIDRKLTNESNISGHFELREDKM
jgi:hypothetical protein